MKAHKRLRAQILFVAALIFLYGCSSSSLSEHEKDKDASSPNLSGSATLTQ